VLSSGDKLYRLVPYWAAGIVPGLLTPVPNAYTGTDFTRNPPLKSGGGGLVSTARDFMRFAQVGHGCDKCSSGFPSGRAGGLCRLWCGWDNVSSRSS
jgi:CubicO group peptidase (beta-lactamase class C family)